MNALASNTLNKICQIQYRILQVVYGDFNKSYELLELNNDLSIDQRHLRYLGI